MKIKYELNNTHVCHENICFKIPSVLIKNLTDNSNIYIYTTSKWIIMVSKGKTLVQDYSQPKRLLVGRPIKMHESASSGVKSKGTTSLQGDVLAEVTYSNGDIIIALQEVLAQNLQFHNSIYSELLDSIKLILDNLQFAFTKNHRDVFQQTLRALEIHIVNLTAQNEVYACYYANLVSEKTFVSENDLVSENETFRSHLVNYSNFTNDPYLSQLSGKEDVHSKDKMTIMGTDYARLSLKTQSMLRSVVANLPTDIQLRILESKAMFKSFDLWFKSFKKLVTTTILDPDELDEDRKSVV